MSNFDSTYSAIASITDGKYDSTYSALKAAAVSMGAEDKDYDSEYSVAVALAEVAGNGGGSSSNSGITMKELLEEAKRPDNEKKYAFDYDYNKKIYHLYEVWSLVPYIDDFSTGLYRPLREMNYNYDNSQFEYVKNENGDDAYFTSNWNFRTNYQPKIDNTEYWWRVDNPPNYSPLKDLGLKTGDLIPNNFVVYDYISSDLAGFPFGFKTEDEYGNESFKYPFTHYIYGGYIGKNREWWGRIELRRTGEESVPYMDKIDYNDGLSNPICAIFGVNRTTIGYGGYLENDLGYFSKYVYTGNGPIGWFSSDSTEMTTIDELDSLNELKFVSASGYGFGTIYCVLNAPIDLKFFWDLSSISSTGNTKYLDFRMCDKLKSIEIDFGDTYRSNTILVSFRDLKNVEYIKFNSTKGGGYKIGGMSAESADNMFFGCVSLKTIPDLDTSNIKNMFYMFRNCKSLTSIPLLDCGKVTNANGMLYGCESLTNLGGFKDLKVSITYDFLDQSTNLTTESLMNVINNLYDLTANGLSGKTLKFGTTNLNKLNSDQIAVATNKGWTLT